MFILSSVLRWQALDDIAEALNDNRHVAWPRIAHGIKQEGFAIFGAED